MAAQVYMPQRQSSDAFSKLLTIGGAAAGGLMGGPKGALAGAQVGGMAGGLFSSNQGKGPDTVATPDNPMARRLQARSGDSFEALKQGAIALQAPDVPPELRAEYTRPVLTAYMNEAKNRGIVNPFEGFPKA